MLSHLPHRKAISQPSLLICLAGFVLYVLHLTHSTHFNFAYDPKGHTEYIQYIAKNWALPHPSDCWECFHPPLYYITGAFAYRLTEALDLNPINGLRCLALGYYLI